MTEREKKLLRLACYSVNVTMSAVSCLSPVLFLTFRSLYGISFSLLGFLVLINFVTQLGVDLLLSFFSHKIDLQKAVRSIPLIAIAGFLIYGIFPVVFPRLAFLFLVLGTVVFASASGLAEVLISPVIASIPSPDPDREMSKLHSVYAWGCVGVVVFSAAYLALFGNGAWFLLALLFALLPATSALLFRKAPLPEMEKPERVTGALKLLCDKRVLISVLAIFLSGASECTMGQWCSGYLEKAVGIPKLWGDLFGTALFSAMLGLGRSLYGTFGGRIRRIVSLGFCGAALCYLAAALTPFPLLGLFACAFSGFCVSMLWPGNLVIASGRNPHAGVFIYAIMASGGDLGASVGPQLMGVLTDTVSASAWGSELAASLSLSPESLGLKVGMLVGMLFPVLGFFVTLLLGNGKRRRQYEKN